MTDATCDACGEPITGEPVEAAKPPVKFHNMGGDQRTELSFRKYHAACADDLPADWIIRRP